MLNPESSRSAQNSTYHIIKWPKKPDKGRIKKRKAEFSRLFFSSYLSFFSLALLVIDEPCVG